tara:strand:- start:25 stop:489 length:465 start_codon:yes stop_codon:yes gene_type:complete
MSSLCATILEEHFTWKETPSSGRKSMYTASWLRRKVYIRVPFTSVEDSNLFPEFWSVFPELGVFKTVDSSTAKHIYRKVITPPYIDDTKEESFFVDECNGTAPKFKGDKGLSANQVFNKTYALRCIVDSARDLDLYADAENILDPDSFEFDYEF